MDILRFMTAGSVDDGKSTLIGRLLYDSKNIFADQLIAIEKVTKKNEKGETDLALLTDGLRAEREQGITIDVAYRYFSTPKRKFIVADAPGHIQYTRNMITAASHVDLAVILIDARHGVTNQTRRHSIITSLLQIPNIIIAINKIDLVGYSQNVFEDIILEYSKFARQLELQEVTYIPISALDGDNIVVKSLQTPWFAGKPLLEYLEDVQINTSTDLSHARFQVQYVIRPQTSNMHDYRGYAGKITSGIYHKGDKIKVLSAGIESVISAIEASGIEKEKAFAPQSVILRLENNIDISRGDIIVKITDMPQIANEVDVLLCWMDKKPMHKGNQYLLQHNSRIVKAQITEINYKINITTLEKNPAEEAFLNDIVHVRVKLAAALVFDSYRYLKTNGSLILIDETSYNTAAGGVIQ